MEGQSPGQTISPQSGDKPAHSVEPTTATPQPVVSPAQAGQDKPVSSTSRPHHAHVPGESISWTASEFVDHNKSLSWYLALALAAVIGAAITFFATHDKITTSVVIVAALVFGFLAARKPQVIEYRLDDAGLAIGNKLYDYDSFKSFSIIDEGAVPSIYLLPLKRFMPARSIYYASDDEEKIVEMLADRLPLEDRHVDAVDRLMHRIRF